MPDQLNRFNRVKYILYSDTNGTLQIREPKGWNDDQKELKRSEKLAGVFSNFSNNLAFYSEAKVFLKACYEAKGIKAVVRLEKWVRNSDTDKWETDYSGYLNFSTYRTDRSYTYLKFDESQFFKNIETRMKEKYELERLTDLKGNALGLLSYKNLTIQGRDIFRESLLKNTRPYYMYKTGSNLTVDGFNFPFELIYKSDENVFQPAIGVDDNGMIDNATAFTTALGASIGQFFYVTADNTNEITVKIKGTFKFQKFSSGTRNFRFRFARYLYDESTGALSAPIYESLIDPLGPLDFSTISQAEGQKVIVVDKTFTFNKRIGDTFTIFCDWPTDIYPLRVDYDQCSITLQEDDLGKVTNSKALRVYDVIDRLLTIITGKQCFQSDLLNGDWRDLLLTNGFKIREVPDKNITISLEEIIDGLLAIDDVCLIIQNETVRLEKRVRAFDFTGTVIDLGKVSKIERALIEKLHYSSINIGFDFDGKYEEVNGLDEFNINSSYSTCIDTTENEFKAISKVRADAYGITLAQLKPYISFPKLDTAYDKVNFFIDAKLITGVDYELRHWQDDFAQIPTGIFSPETAFNLRLSPFNSLIRKAKTISTGLQKFPTELLVYSSTQGNSQLVTLYPERASIPNSILAKPYYFPEEIKFAKKITLQQFKQISNNPYNLIKFVNEYGKVEYGFIYPSVKPNKEGSFTLIKANF